MYMKGPTRVILVLVAATNGKTSLRKCTVLPYSSLLAYTQSKHVYIMVTEGGNENSTHYPIMRILDKST